MMNAPTLEVVLTPAQMRVYALLLEMYVTTGRVIIRDLAERCGYCINGLVCHLKPLKRKGWIKSTRRTSASIVPLMRLEFFRPPVNVRMPD